MKNDFIYCSACGLKNLREDNKCGGCGASLHNDTSALSTSETSNYNTGKFIIVIVIIAIIYYFYRQENPSKNNSMNHENIIPNESDNTSEQSQNNITYTILKQSENIGKSIGSNVVLSIYNADIRIENKLNEEDLKSLCYILKSEIKTKATSIRYFFYLPGMVVDNGAWATAVFNPDLEVTIFGPSKAEENDAKKYVNNSTSNYIGHWIDYSSTLHIIYGIKQVNGKFILDGYSTDDNSYGTMAELTLSKKGNKTIYLSDRPEEYYIINSNGDLDVYDAQGYIVTYQKVE